MKKYSAYNIWKNKREIQELKSREIQDKGEDVASDFDPEEDENMAAAENAAPPTQPHTAPTEPAPDHYEKATIATSVTQSAATRTTVTAAAEVQTHKHTHTNKHTHTTTCTHITLFVYSIQSIDAFVYL
jgi:hypothetical protein